MVPVATAVAHFQPPYMRKLITINPKETYVYNLAYCQPALHRVPSYQVVRDGWNDAVVLSVPTVACRRPCFGSHRHAFHSTKTMNFVNCLLDAVQTSDEEITDVIIDQAFQTSGFSQDSD